KQISASEAAGRNTAIDGDALHRCCRCPACDAAERSGSRRNRADGSTFRKRITSGGGRAKILIFKTVRVVRARLSGQQIGWLESLQCTGAAGTVPYAVDACRNRASTAAGAGASDTSIINVIHYPVRHRGWQLIKVKMDKLWRTGICTAEFIVNRITKLLT